MLSGFAASELIRSSRKTIERIEERIENEEDGVPTKRAAIAGRGHASRVAESVEELRQEDIDWNDEVEVEFESFDDSFDSLTETIHDEL